MCKRIQTCLLIGECTESEMQNADSLTRNIQPVVYNTIVVIITQLLMMQLQQRQQLSVNSIGANTAGMFLDSHRILLFSWILSQLCRFYLFTRVVP